MMKMKMKSRRVSTHHHLHQILIRDQIKHKQCSDHEVYRPSLCSVTAFILIISDAEHFQF